MGPQHVTNGRILNTFPTNLTTGRVVTTEKIIRSSTLIRSDIFPMHNQNQERNRTILHSTVREQLRRTTVANALSL